MKAEVDEKRKSFRGREDEGCEPKVSRQPLFRGHHVSPRMCQHLIGDLQGSVLM
jgi:hypothetical protein